MISFVLNFWQISERIFLFGCSFNVIEKFSAFFWRSCHNSSFDCFFLQIRRNLFKLVVLDSFTNLTLSLSFSEGERSDFDALTISRKESATSSLFSHGVGGFCKVEHTFLPKLQMPVCLFSLKVIISFSDGDNTAEIVEKFFCVDISNRKFCG